MPPYIMEKDLDKPLGLNREIFEDEIHILRKRIKELKEENARQKSVEKVLRREASFASSFVRHSPAFFVVIDQDGIVRLMNDSMLSTLGYSMDEVLGKEYVSLFVPAGDRREVRDIFDRLVTQTGPTINQNRIITKDGRYLLIEWRGHSIRKPDESLDYFFGVGIDITVQKKMEEALKWNAALFESLVNKAIDGILIIDENHKRLVINQQLVDMLDIPQKILDTTDGNPLTDFIVDGARYPEQVLEKITYLYKNPDETSRDEIEFKNGLVVDRYSAPIAGNGRYHGRIWTFRDITERKYAEEALYESEVKYHSLFENAVEGIFQTSPQGHFISVNPTHAKLFGYESPYDFIEQINDIERQHYVHPEDRRKFQNILEAKGTIKGFETQLAGKDGKIVWASINASTVRNAEGDVVSYEGTLEDITERKMAERQLKESEETLTSLINATDETLLLVDTQGTILIANEITARRFGKKVEEIIGYSQYDFFPPDLASRKDHYDEVILTGKPITFEDEEGGIFYETLAYPVFDDQGKVIKIAIFTKDISDRKLAEENLRRLSVHDSLTGLYNRFFFEEELKRFGSGRFDPVGIVMCDLDGLKLVNDNLGHAAGDHQIIAAARLLKEQFRGSDIVARIGGDEFAVLLPNCSIEVLNEIHERLSKAMINRFIPNTGIPVMLSTGYAIGEGSDSSIEQLLKKADENMYDEKNRHRELFKKYFAEIKK